MTGYEKMTNQELKDVFKRLYQARRGEFNPNRPVLQAEWEDLLEVLNRRLTLSEKDQFIDEMKAEANAEAKICHQCESIMTGANNVGEIKP